MRFEIKVASFQLFNLHSQEVGNIQLSLRSDKYVNWAIQFSS
jgi:hypothetical protein